MKTEITKLPRSQAKIHVELEATEYDKYKKLAAEDVSKHIEIPGFRKGFAPADVVEKHVGAHALLHEAMEKAIQESYVKAVIDSKLDVITRPKIDITSEDPLIFDATVAVMPEVKVTDYKSIKIPKEEVAADEKEIEDVLENLRKQRAEYKDISRPVKKGDKVEMDFEGFDAEGKTLEGTKSKNHPIIIGEGVLLKDFEDNLEGLKAEDKKEFEVQFPKDYHHKPYADKKIKFKVDIKKTQEVVLPELTDEFIEKAVGEKMTVAELKKRIGDNLVAQKAGDAKAKREDSFIEKLLVKTETEVPELLLEEEVEYIIEQMKGDLQTHNFKWEDYLTQRKKTEEEIRQELQKEAEKRIKIRFALQFLFKAEDIKVEEVDIETELARIVESYPESDRPKAKEQLRDRNTLVQIKNRLALDKLFKLFLE